MDGDLRADFSYLAFNMLRSEAATEEQLKGCIEFAIEKFSEEKLKETVDEKLEELEEKLGTLIKDLLEEAKEDD